MTNFTSKTYKTFIFLENYGFCINDLVSFRLVGGHIHFLFNNGQTDVIPFTDSRIVYEQIKTVIIKE